MILMLQISALSLLTLSSSPFFSHAFMIVSPPTTRQVQVAQQLSLPLQPLLFVPLSSSSFNHQQQQNTRIVLCGTGTSNKNNNNNNNNEDDTSNAYLDKASKLRKEVEELESQMTAMRSKKDTSSSSTNVDVDGTKGGNKVGSKGQKQSISYKTLNDSMWTISYRFASNPISQGDESDTNDSSGVVVGGGTNTFYSGKISILLKGDGYTELIEPIDTNTNTNSNTKSLSFQKMWGWDEEVSRENDKKTYLSFSADVILPPTDINYDTSKPNEPSRFYFNAEVNTDSKTGEISLIDGTVTVKRDVTSPAGGGRFWGIFNAGGILAQFRYCGEFLMKPTTTTSQYL